MIFATIVIDGTSAVPAIRKKIPAGIVGAKIRMEFDKSWQGLRKMAVFQALRDADNVTKDVWIENEDAVEIPWEVVDRPANMIRVGVYGTNGEENLVIPTLWADLGRVYYAADPSGDESADPTPPIWEKILSAIGDLEDLDTEARENLVAAINEAAKTCSAESLQETIEEILAKSEIQDIGGGEQLKNDVSTLQQQVADLLYVPIDITKFTHNAGTVEMGSVVEELTLTWELNKVPISQTVEGKAVDVSARSETLTGMNMTQSRTFTMTATDEREKTDSATTTVNFLNGIYYGAAAAPEALDGAFLLALEKKTLSSARGRTIDATAADGQHIWYALPARLGTCKFTVGGFEGGFDLAATMDFTNAKGYTESYYIYRSGQTGLGETKVVIS